MGFKILFISFNNANIKFTNLEKLIWRTYTTAETLSTTSKVELIDKKDFANMARDKNSEIFVIYDTTLEI